MAWDADNVTDSTIISDLDVKITDNFEAIEASWGSPDDGFNPTTDIQLAAGKRILGFAQEFNGQLSSDLTVATGELTIITWTSVRINVDSRLLDNKSYTPEIKSKAMLFGNVIWSNAEVGKDYRLSISKNGTEWKEIIKRCSVAGNVVITISDLVPIDGTGDYFELNVFHNSTGDKYIQSGSGRSAFYGYLLPLTTESTS